MSPITTRPQTQDDDARVVKINNHLFPEFPPMTVDLYRHFIEQWKKIEAELAIRYRVHPSRN